ncbi:BadF/BadG/BcrA/BcrD ATPase family protein [uncultured Eubacteriales bacterium]|uniref:BadF/BadG/BcrA/BcrD ATPase family protein n=1 Tax=uncultured Eubacteriales bacterium TaxID=172733 RepID=A0A212IZ79_9FIRM|nr:BadF/BadG/BcrA/BcrD ATPase family protein [uncultured Eubacteriales bacterium]
MVKPLLVGIDGGGTKTRVMARRVGEFRPLLDRAYPESNYQSIGMSAVTRVLGLILDDLRPFFPPDHREVSLAMGMAGIDRESDVELYLAALRELGYEGRAVACNDARIALMGAHGGDVGAIVICGTGSIATGLTADGRELRAGGWGALAGDEGSGYRLGIEGISAVFRAYDGSGAETGLTRQLLALYGKTTVPDLLDVLDGGDGLPVRAVAAAARPVLELSETDGVCREIVRRQAAALAGVAGALASRMGRPDFPLALMGGLLRNVPGYADLFLTNLKSAYPDINITSPQGDAAQGALLLAERLYGQGRWKGTDL